MNPELVKSLDDLYCRITIYFNCNVDFEPLELFDESIRVLKSLPDPPLEKQCRTCARLKEMRAR